MLKIALISAVASLGLCSSKAGAGERPYSEGHAPTVGARAFPNLTPIYAGSGVRDSGQPINTGTATSFLCTNWTAANQILQFVIKQYGGTQLTAKAYTVSPGRTWTVSTHATLAFYEDALLTPDLMVEQGSFRILATAAGFSCSVSVIDAAGASPVGIDLHLVRSNPTTGTQE